jgi:exosome complex exonuclease DIS3/RRP44
MPLPTAQTKRFLKRARGAGAGTSRQVSVLHVSREHYLRNDLPLPPAPTLRPFLLVPDTNVLLGAVAIFDCDVVQEVVFLQTVLQETRKRNQEVYDRIRRLIASPPATRRHLHVFSNEHCEATFLEQLRGESPNDYNDRLIRRAVSWLNAQYDSLPEPRVVLLTQDRENARRAREEDRLTAFELAEVMAWTAHAADEELKALVAQWQARLEFDNSRPDQGVADEVSRREPWFYPEYWSPERVERGLAAGELLRGVFRAAMYEPIERGTVVVRTAQVTLSNAIKKLLGTVADTLRITIKGAAAVNRSIDGDLVAVQLMVNELHGDLKLARGTNQAAIEHATDTATELVMNAAAVLDSSTDDIQDRVTKPDSYTGQIVAVLERHWRPQYCGSLQPDKSDMPNSLHQVRRRHLFFPVDRRVPPVYLETRQGATLYGQRLAIAIDRWERHSRFPVGHLVRALGPIGEKQVETQVLLLENGIVIRPFSEAALACLPPIDWSAEPSTAIGKSSTHRLDLRSLFVFSIDPPGCTDIDDALHCRLVDSKSWEGNGSCGRQRLQVGIHIADVASFVLPGTRLDEEARERGCTVYLVDQRMEMLPSRLTSNLCSLVANQDRYAFSVLFELDSETAQVYDVQFTRSIIRSRASLTYDQAQEMLDALVADKKTAQELQIPELLGDALPLLACVAAKLRAKRVEAGALMLASPEIRFEAEELGPSAHLSKTCRTFDTHHLVEEFMLLANITVAKRIVHQFPNSACLRKHPPPTPEQIEPLLQAASAYGIELSTASSKSLAESLDKVSETPAGKADTLLETLLRMLATRCMMQAAYFSAGSGAPSSYYHYGLAVPLYTHFTSPIRRYADILVHRQLAVCLGYDEASPELLTSQHVEHLCEHINERYRCAQAAGRASAALHVLLWFRRHSHRSAETGNELWSMITDARILRFVAHGLVVFLPQFGFEGVARLDEESWIYDDDSACLRSRNNDQVYRILGPCRVCIKVTPDAIGSEHVRLEVVP